MIDNANSVLTPLVEWGVAARAFDGRTESGDQYLVESFPNGVLVAVVDGLGHGPNAVVAGKTAIAALRDRGQDPVALLLRRCHESLRRTRGVVMSLASFDAVAGIMTWLGVGNVKGLLLSKAGEARCTQERLLLRGGVVGYNLPTLRPTVLPVARGDTLVFATDGLRSAFAHELALGSSLCRTE
jgi:negative regulator of sigma-B (phosphoserine phosphatase)